MNISRRDFLKGTAAAALGVVASTTLPTVAMADGEEKKYEIPELLSERDFEESMAEYKVLTPEEEKDYDVVVVGAGTAGVPAALSAFEAGCSVACLQKESIAIAQGGNGSGFYPEK